MRFKYRFRTYLSTKKQRPLIHSVVEKKKIGLEGLKQIIDEAIVKSKTQ